MAIVDPRLDNAAKCLRQTYSTFSYTVAHWQNTSTEHNTTMVKISDVSYVKGIIRIKEKAGRILRNSAEAFK